MNDAARPSIVLCAYTEEMLAAKGYNEPGNCGRCGTDIIISEGTLEIPGAEHICPRCFLDDEKLNMQQTGRVTEKTSEIIRQELGEEGVAAMRMSQGLPVGVIAAIMEAEHQASKKGLWS